jgi:predicted RNase H-like HicB family nuclease
MKYAVVYHKTRTGYSAEVPDLPGCIAAAKTMKQTERLMKEAIEMHLEMMKEMGEKISAPVTHTNYVHVRPPVALHIK